MTDTLRTREWTRPLGDLLTQVAVGVAEGQTALDSHSRATQAELDRAVAAGDLEYALEAPWYRFAEVEADVRVAMSVHAREERDANGEVRAYRPLLAATPLSPRLHSERRFDAEAASDVRVRIVPVPPEE